jgi:hypothetical protein
MNSRIDTSRNKDKINEYEALETINDNSTNYSKEISKEQVGDQINLQIEKDKIVNSNYLLKNRGNNQLPGKIGNLRILKYDENGDPLIAIGPHWPFFICLSTSFFFIFYFYLFFLWDYLDTSIIIIAILIYLLQVSAYTSVSLKNPGIPKSFFALQKTNALDTMEQGFKFCSRCKIVTSISLKTNHCYDCDVCIVGKNKDKI